LLSNCLGLGDEIRYRFADHVVVLRRVDANHVMVEVDGVVVE
jgi:Fe2+ transport system protein FeoA